MRPRRSLRSWIRSEWVVLVGLILTVVFGVAFVRELTQRAAIRREIRDLQQEVESLKSRREELRRLIADFQSASTQEREARNKLNLLRPGEKSLLVQETPSATPTSGGVTTPERPADQSYPVRWWQYFFGSE